ncbi:hypothetical protein O181_014408 [Austropuccinia psidii MF-1]|uniref:Uncharacterized protein n=1 Tax=Austropuccinia psidii MF-1 TaxID=1389203 RepID=A0A9Q3C0H4_9BASI|nr:hypothetical protein [Austropuccinia psidii MF-1]
MTPLHHHHIGRGILAHHPSGPQQYFASLGDCMELVAFPNECFVQEGFRNWSPHMRMSHNYVPAHATSTTLAHRSAFVSAQEPAHANSGSTYVTPKCAMPLEIKP